MNIREDPYFQLLIEERDLKETTIKLYALVLNEYCTFLQTPPSRLIESALKEEDKGIRKAQRRVRKHLTKYRKNLQNKEYSPKTIKTHITIIRSFYNEFEVELPRLRLKNKHEETLTTSKDIPGKEHIRCALKHANLKYKAVINLMCQSGMGSAEIRSLKNKDLLDAAASKKLDLEELKKIDILTWKIKRVKTNKPYFTFSGPDSINTLIDYLEQKHRNTPFNNDDHLFGRGNKVLAKRTLEGYFIELNTRCDFGFHGRQRFFTSHKLRKYFATTLEASRMPHLMIRWLMGHSIDSVTNAYFKPDVDALRHEYIRVLPSLSLSDVKSITIESEDVKKIKADLEEKYRGEMDEFKAEVLRHIQGKQTLQNKKELLKK
jgi:integrase